MAEQYTQVPPAEFLLAPSTGDYKDVHGLVLQLSSKKRALETVTANVMRVVSSPSTYPLVVRDPQEGRIRSMATLNISRTHRGADPWIDDVVTELPAFRGKKYSKPVMSTAEALAREAADQVRLTSSASRDDARQGYAKRGYKLITDVLYRNEKALRQLPMPDSVEVLDTMGERDVLAIARLLDQAPETAEQNVREVFKSPHSALLGTRDDQGEISGIATGFSCPIPVGWKSWVEVDAPDPADQAALIVAAEHVMPPDASSLNTLFAPPAETGDGYELRDSGLYILPLVQGKLINTSY